MEEYPRGAATQTEKPNDRNQKQQVIALHHGNRSNKVKIGAHRELGRAVRKHSRHSETRLAIVRQEVGISRHAA
jgi:hypothetical protein